MIKSYLKAADSSEVENPQDTGQLATNLQMLASSSQIASSTTTSSNEGGNQAEVECILRKCRAYVEHHPSGVSQ